MSRRFIQVSVLTDKSSLFKMLRDLILPVLSVVVVSQALMLRKFVLIIGRWNNNDLFEAGGLTKCKSDDNDCIMKVANEILSKHFQG